MVVCFAICGTLAFAQTRHSVASMHRNDNQNVAALTQSAPMQRSVGYNASIFTKAEGDVIYHCDFRNQDGTDLYKRFSTNTVKEGDLLGGVEVTVEESHRQTGNYGKWKRFDSASVEYMRRQTLASDYPALYRWFGGQMEKSVSESMDSTKCTSNNGWMFMDVFDQTQTPNGNAFNAFVRFDEWIDLGDAPMFDISIYQYYMKYYDQCFVDYCVNGEDTWYPAEINVTNIDVIVNGSINGVSTYTMPYNAVRRAREASNETYKNKIRLRVRWYSNARSTSAGYGYCWMFDDFKVIAGGESRINPQPEYYTEGLYQLMPKGFEFPIFWHSHIVNGGSLEQGDINTTIYNYKDGQVTPTVVASSFEAQGMDRGGAVEATVDPKGRFGGESNFGWYCASGNVPHATTGNPGHVKTDEVGDYYVYAQLKSTPEGNGDELTHTFDTIYYKVVDQDENGSVVWGHDNGVITGYRAFMYGYVRENDNPFITEYSKNYATNGYSVSVRYTTGDVVPEGWVIRGVEYVPATDTTVRKGNATIVPTLTEDSCIAGQGDYVSFKNVRTGAGNVDITDDYHANAGRVTTGYLCDPAKANGFLEHGEYPTIFVEFPEQPKLEANKSYRVGYQLAANGNFAVAASSPSHYYIYSNEAHDSIRYREFSDLNDTNPNFFPDSRRSAKYRSHTTKGGMVDNPYDVRIYDPEEASSLFASNYYGYYPMIHLVIGPYVEKEKVNVDINCEFEDEDESLGNVRNENQNEVCGTTDQVTEGSTVGYYVRANADGHIDSVYIDGVRAWAKLGAGRYYFNDELDDDILVEDYDQYKNDTIIFFGFAGVADDHEIKAYFGAGRVGINNFANNVTMKMQPNPATSQVRLNVEGVSGMLDCSLIDMSGRVVYNTMMNAEAPQTISLNGLAKGAYFVRITNSKFSKVEKLIVR